MLQKSSMFKTKEIFFVEPSRKHYLTSISRNTKIAHTSIKKNIQTLQKEGFIKEIKEIRGTRTFPHFLANTNRSFIEQKMIYNISTLLETNLITFLEEKLMPKAIVLFGSYRRGEDREDSDIDLFIESKNEQIDLKKFEKKLKRNIQLHFKETFTSYPKELKNNIINGIVLFGFLEGFR